MGSDELGELRNLIARRNAEVGQLLPRRPGPERSGAARLNCLGYGTALFIGAACFRKWQ
jgi:hypothetical protein